MALLASVPPAIRHGTGNRIAPTPVPASVIGAPFRPQNEIARRKGDTIRVPFNSPARAWPFQSASSSPHD